MVALHHLVHCFRLLVEMEAVVGLLLHQVEVAMEALVLLPEVVVLVVVQVVLVVMVIIVVVVERQVAPQAQKAVMEACMVVAVELCQAHVHQGVNMEVQVE